MSTNYGGYRNARRHSLPPRDRQDSYAREVSPRGTEYTPSEFPRSQPGYDERTELPRSEYAATEAPRRASQYQLAPYDDEKAYAEWNRVYGPESGYGQPPPPPPTEPDCRSERRAPRRERKVRHSDRRPNDPVSYDEYGRPYDDMSLDRRSPVYDDRDYRRDSRQPRPPLERTASDKTPEEGLKSSLIGGASGAYLGSRLLGKGALGTLGGAIAGAIGVNAIEHFDGKRRQKKVDSEQPRRRGDRREDALVYTPPRERRSGYYSHDEYGSPARSRYDSRPPPRSRYADRPQRKRSRNSSSDGYGYY